MFYLTFTFPIYKEECSVQFQCPRKHIKFERKPCLFVRQPYPNMSIIVILSLWPGLLYSWGCVILFVLKVNWFFQLPSSDQQNGGLMDVRETYLL